MELKIDEINNGELAKGYAINRIHSSMHTLADRFFIPLSKAAVIASLALINKRITVNYEEKYNVIFKLRAMVAFTTMIVPECINESSMYTRNRKKFPIKIMNRVKASIFKRKQIMPKTASKKRLRSTLRACKYNLDSIPTGFMTIINDVYSKKDDLDSINSIWVNRFLSIYKENEKITTIK